MSADVIRFAAASFIHSVAALPPPPAPAPLPLAYATYGNKQSTACAKTVTANSSTGTSQRTSSSGSPATCRSWSVGPQNAPGLSCRSSFRRSLSTSTFRDERWGLWSCEGDRDVREGGGGGGVTQGPWVEGYLER